MSDDQPALLLVVEHDEEQVKPASLRAVTAARQLGGAYALVCVGNNLDAVADEVANLGALKVYLADHEALTHPLADRYAKVIAQVTKKTGSQTILAASSTFSRDLLPRVAALLDAPMLSDVTHIHWQPGQTVYQRHVNAGRELATVTLETSRSVLSIRPAAFELPEPAVTASPRESVAIDPTDLPDGMRFVWREEQRSPRPELTEARVVVAGGRPIQDRETYQRLVERLADTLGGAVGATRALVDAGIVPNDWQIGQTGKVISPELYIALGISGAVQHLAGIRDARVIVAINKDPSAPMMQVANYSLAGDLFELVPQLIESLSNQP